MADYERVVWEVSDALTAGSGTLTCCGSVGCGDMKARIQGYVPLNAAPQCLEGGSTSTFRIAA